MGYNGINHIALVTSNLDRTIRFWRDLLGLRLLASMGKTGYKQYFFEVSKTDMVSFFEWSGVKPVEEKEHGRTVSVPFVFDHICLGVESPDDLWEIKERLEAEDEWVSEVIDHGFIHSIYTFDPNGIALEFSYYVNGIDVREKPVMGDRDPTDIALEGLTPQRDKLTGRPVRTPDDERKIYPGEMRGYFLKDEK